MHVSISILWVEYIRLVSHMPAIAEELTGEEGTMSSQAAPSKITDPCMRRYAVLPSSTQRDTALEINICHTRLSGNTLLSQALRLNIFKDKKR